MNATRLWTLGSVIVMIAVLVGTWFIGISPRLAEAATANGTTASVEAQNASHAATLASLKEQFEDIDQLRDDVEELRLAIPENAGVPSLISHLNALAANAGVTISAITFRDPEAYAPIENVDQDPELATALAGVPTDSFYVIPVDLAITGPYQNTMAFLAGLQAGQRLFLAHDLALVEGTMTADSQVDLNISGQVFTLVNTSAAPTVPAVTETGTPAPDGGEIPQ